MLNGGVGKEFRSVYGDDFSGQASSSRKDARVLIVDATIGSRLALVGAVTAPGVVVDSATSLSSARHRISAQAYDVVIADHEIDGGAGLDFLLALKRRGLDMALVLIADLGKMVRTPESIRAAGVDLVLAKPLRPDSLKRSLQSLVLGKQAYRAWRHLRPSVAASGSRRSDTLRRRRGVALRGVLAGLNSCESEAEVYGLLDLEFGQLFGLDAWVWLHDDRPEVSVLESGGSAEERGALGELSEGFREALGQALVLDRVTRVALSGGAQMLGWTIELPGTPGGRITTVVRVSGGDVSALAGLLQELMGGLRLALGRISTAKYKARIASELARRVSEELRTPMGALSHAIERLTGEAHRMGLSSEWVDRVRSESERVARAVEHLEGEMRPGARN